MENPKNINKVNELINSIDPDKIQCSDCRRWFPLKEHLSEILWGGDPVCKSCTEELRRRRERLNEKMKEDYEQENRRTRSPTRPRFNKV